jgi:hypothetical protein
MNRYRDTFLTSALEIDEDGHTVIPFQPGAFASYDTARPGVRRHGVMVTVEASPEKGNDMVLVTVTWAEPQ